MRFIYLMSLNSVSLTLRDFDSINHLQKKKFYTAFQKNLRPEDQETILMNYQETEIICNVYFYLFRKIKKNILFAIEN